MGRCFALIGLLFAADSAFAHKFYVEAKLAEPIRIEAYFEDDTPAQEAKIIVRQGETIVAEGRTDEKGVWTCTLPPGNYQVRAETLGHAAETTLGVPDKPVEPIAATDNQRTENTRTPLRRLVMGLGIIAGVTIVSYVLRQRSRASR